MRVGFIKGRGVILCVMAVLIMALPLSVFAADVPAVDFSVKVHDFADILSDEDEEKLQAASVNMAEQHGMDTVILTTNDSLGKTPLQYSEEFYDNNFFGIGDEADGLILYINMTDRDVYIAVCGRSNVIFSENIQNRMLDDIAPRLSDGDYYGACLLFIDGIGQYAGRVSEPEVNSKYEEITRELDRQESEGKLTLLGAAGIAVIISGCFVLILIMIHSTSKPKKPDIRTYLDGKGMRVTNTEDRFLTTKTTRTAIPQNDNHSGGSGGGGIHRSSGGNTFSGSGRKF